MYKLIQIFFTLLIVSNVIQAQNILYSESFTDSTLENSWYRAYVRNDIGNNMIPAKFLDNPSGDGWVGELSSVRGDSGGVAISYSGSEKFSDFYMEANVYLPIGGIFGVEYSGIEFRLDTLTIDTVLHTRAYQLVANFRNDFGPQKLRFRKRNSESPPFDVIRDFTIAEIPGGIPADSGWHKLAVKAVGNQFWLYYDDQELPDCPYTDETGTEAFTEGWIAAYTFIIDSIPLPQHSLFIDDITVESVPTSIGDKNQKIPTGCELHQNYPNPFNPSTTIQFDLPSANLVQLEIFNIVGQKVRTLVSTTYPVGSHQINWNARDDKGNEVPAGVYYYQLRVGDFEQTRKMLLVK